MASASRAPLIASAVQFLRDPAASSSPLAKRIAYLESRGLTPQEIELAITTASGSGPAPPPGFQQAYPSRRGGPEFDRDWRDWFIMAVVGGGVGWVAVKLAQVSGLVWRLGWAGRCGWLGWGAQRRGLGWADSSLKLETSFCEKLHEIIHRR